MACPHTSTCIQQRSRCMELTTQYELTRLRCTASVKHHCLSNRKGERLLNSLSRLRYDWGTEAGGRGGGGRGCGCAEGFMTVGATTGLLPPGVHSDQYALFSRIFNSKFCWQPCMTACQDYGNHYGQRPATVKSQR